MRTLAPLLFALPLLVLTTGCPQEEAGGEAAAAHASPPADAFVDNIPALPEGARSLTVTVGDAGYEPNTLEAGPKETVVLAFTRTSKSPCGQYVQVLGTDTRAELPLNETVNIPVEMPESGTVTFACGMDMMRGVINVVAVDLPPSAEPAAAGDAPEAEKAG
ncbi:MAG: cupredoxin domain-containing protein [Deltaproteobacteria bacterium]|nr:cupredoxin domain-containing protein [Deltaproteobacteria bacterium]